jgi:hypothetical protein
MEKLRFGRERYHDTEDEIEDEAGLNQNRFGKEVIQ